MFKKLNIGVRLSIGFGFVLVLFCVLTLFSINRIQFISAHTNQIYNHPLAVSNAVLRINTNIIKIHRSMKDVALSVNTTDIDRDAQLVDELEKIVYADFEIISNWFLGERTLYSNAKNIFIDWKPIRDEVISLMIAEHRDRAVEITRGKGANHVIEIENAMNKLSTFAEGKAAELLDSAEKTTHEMLWVMYLLLLSVVVISVAFTFYLTRTITRPLKVLEDSTQEIGKGKFDAVIDVDEGGEIGALARSFSNMATNLSKSVADRKKAEESLLKLSSAIEQAGEAIIITDKEGIIEYANPAFTKLTGYSAEEVIGQTPKILRSGNEDTAFYEDMWNTIARGKVWHGKVVNKRKDGSFYPTMLTISPVYNQSLEGASFSHFVSIQSDLIELEDMEHQFHQAQKMEAIGTLVGGIAHDFNNMLAGMTGNLYLAKKRAEEMPEVTKNLDSIEDIAFRAADMIKQLLTFARKGMVNIKQIPLNPFIKETLKLLRTSVPENIDLHQDICSDALQINGDSTQLHQVLLNLIGNACDAVEGVDNPTISIRLEAWHPDQTSIDRHSYFKDKPYAHLSVEDNGIGIPEHQIEHLFEPFFTTKEQGEGTGLGLAMAFGAIKTHHGFVEVDSCEGKGSTFHIYIPLLQAKKIVLTPPKEKEVVRGHGESILLVDDNPEIIKVDKEVLKSLGYQVLTAINGQEAVDLIQELSEEIDLCILDVVMPIMSGNKAAQAIRKIKPKTKVIFSTGYDKSLLEGMENEAVLSKPFSIKEMSWLIRKQIDS